MKVGDKLICKKNHGYNGFSEVSYFEVNAEYTIDTIKKWIDHYTIIIDNIGFTYNFNLNYKQINGCYMLYDYFYTKKELRKLKLEVLNGSI